MNHNQSNKKRLLYVNTYIQLETYVLISALKENQTNIKKYLNNIKDLEDCF